MLDVIPPAHPTVSMRTRMRDHSGKCKKRDDADEPRPRNDLAYHNGKGKDREETACDQSCGWDAACRHTVAAIPVGESCGKVTPRTSMLCTTYNQQRGRGRMRTREDGRSPMR